MKNYKVMDKSAFLSKKTLIKEFVELDNGSGMFIQEMSGAGVEIIGKRATSDKEKLNNIESMALLIALSACDENGNLLFDIDDVPSMIENNSIDTLVKLSSVSVRVSKLNSDAVTEAKQTLKND